MQGICFPDRGIHNRTDCGRIVAVEIFDCRQGSSASMVLNGNEEGFTVQNCRVHDNNNIGIDFIGHKQTCPVVALDQARDGQYIGNPVCGSGRSDDGIYVDGVPFFYRIIAPIERS